MTVDTQGNSPPQSPPSAPGPAPTLKSRAKPASQKRFSNAAWWSLLALVLLLLFNLVFTRGFFHVEVRNHALYGSLIDILNRAVPVELNALGMTLVIATAGIDLSVGAVMAIAGAVAACLIARPDYSPLSVINVHGSIALVILISLAVGLLCGLWNGLLVGIIDIQPIVATLILMVAGRGVAQLLTNGQIPTFSHAGFHFLGGGTFLGLPFPVTIGVIAFVATVLLARFTALGMFLESVGNSPKASSFAGINAKLIKIVAYSITGVLAALAGMIITSDIQAADVNNTGLYMELDAILAVAIGGTSLNGGRFSLAGTLVGALVIQTLNTTILEQGVNPAITLVVKAAVVVVVALLQSEKFRNLVTKPLRRAA